MPSCKQNDDGEVELEQWQINAMLGAGHKA
jgi:hypothetical protein